MDKRGTPMFLPGIKLKFITQSIDRGFFYATGTLINTISNESEYCLVKPDNEFSIKRRINDVVTELSVLKIPKSNCQIIGGKNV